jgi:diguanylate cyclase (GGDEF)-like protein
MPTDRPRILIIDDSESDRLLLANALQADYSVVTAENGFEGLGRAITEPQPDVILLDIVMPNLDGYQVLEQLKREEATRQIPVMFLTAKDDELDEVRGFEMGAVDYIAKPYSIPVVVARVASHVKIRRQAALLESMALLDPLTELGNRRRYEEVLHRELGRARRGQRPLSVVLVDVDHFKVYNDRYGHPAGDECLRQVAAALQAVVSRPGDVVARNGGDEFALVLPDSEQEAARTVAERALEAVRSLSIPHESVDPTEYVTLSVGVATALPPVIKNEQELVAAADAALYRAKRKGRDRAEFEVVRVGPAMGPASAPSGGEGTG